MSLAAIRLPTRRYLIDEEGEVWPEGAAALACRIGHSGGEENLPAYAVRNLGYMRIAVQNGAAHVSFRPDLVRPATLVAAFRLITEEGAVRVALTYLKEEPHYEIIGDVEAAFERIEDLVPAMARDQLESPYKALPLDPAHLDESTARFFLPLIAVWTRRHARWSAEITEQITPSAGNNYFVVRAPAGGDRWIIEAMTYGFSFFDEQWAKSAVVGRDFANQPDRQFGAWAAETYRRVARERQPRLDRVNALVRTPGKPMRRTRYSRLLLPWRDGDDDLVMAVSVRRSSVLIDS
jgi:hypothetical protein